MSDTFKKAENIASAVYLITSFFGDQEPLKWRLRSLVADLVSNTVRDKSSVAKEMNTLLSVAKNAGLLSPPNFEILNSEIQKLIEDLDKPLDYSLLEQKNPAIRSGSHSLEVAAVKDNTVQPALTEKDHRVTEKHALKEFGAVSVKKNSRQSVIISLLKRKKEIMIKDVSPLISGCSEKTIQRELSAMVKDGVLRKIGDKRWSRYTLA